MTAERLHSLLRASGFRCQLAFANVTFGGLWIGRVSLLPGPSHRGLNTVDLVQPRSRRYAVAAVDRALEGRLRDSSISLVSPEDFILLKCLSTRDRDLEDAASVIRRNGNRLDHPLLESEVDSLSREIAGHDVRGCFATVRSRASIADLP